MKSLFYIFLFFVFVNITFSQAEEDYASDQEFDPQIVKIIKQYKAKNKPDGKNTMAYISEYIINEQDIFLKENGRNVKQIRINKEEYLTNGPLTYTVKGWCKDLKTNTKSDLIGGYIFGELYLFSVSNTKDKKKLLEQIEDYNNVDKNGQYEFLKFKNYVDRYIIDLSVAKSKVVAKYDNKKINIKYDAPVDYKLDLQLDTLYFKFSPQKQYARKLEMLSPASYSWDIITAKIVGNKMKIIMGYSYGSNSNIQGICGAGVEMGFALYEYDDKGKLVSKNTIDINSCPNGFYYEKLQSKNKNIHKYNVVSDGMGQDAEEEAKKPTGIVTIDLDDPSLKFEKHK